MVATFYAMGFAVSGMFCSLALRMPSQKQDSQRLLLIIEDSVRVMENEGVWFLQCRPKILFQLSIGQKSRNVLIISVLGYGELTVFFLLVIIEIPQMTQRSLPTTFIRFIDIKMHKNIIIQPRYFTRKVRTVFTAETAETTSKRFHIGLSSSGDYYW